MKRIVSDRLIGTGLALAMVAPTVLVVAGGLVAAKASLNAVQVYGDKASAIVHTVSQEIAPHIGEIQAGARRLGEEVERLSNGTTQAFRALSDVGDLRIERGQFGATPSFPIRVPRSDFKIAALENPYRAAGFQTAQFGGLLDKAKPNLRIPAGRLLDTTLPSVPIPATTVALSSAPLRAAFATLGEDGVIGKALDGVHGGIDQTVGKAMGLAAPLARLRDDVLAVLGPLRDLARGLYVGGLLIVAGIVVWLGTHLTAAAVYTLRRLGQATLSFATGGVFGYLGFVRACLRREAHARLFG